MSTCRAVPLEHTPPRCIGDLLSLAFRVKCGCAWLHGLPRLVHSIPSTSDHRETKGCTPPYESFSYQISDITINWWAGRVPRLSPAQLTIRTAAWAAYQRTPQDLHPRSTPALQSASCRSPAREISKSVGKNQSHCSSSSLSGIPSALSPRPYWQTRVRLSVERLRW